MVKVEFLGPIDKEPMEMDISSLKELAKILNEDTEMKKWLDNCAVAVNDRLIEGHDVQLKSGDTVSILPPVCGG